MMNQTKKHTTGKKLLALLLALIMTVSLLPMSVFAAEMDAEETPVVEGQTEPAAEPGADDADQAQEPDADEANEDAVLPGDAEGDKEQPLLPDEKDPIAQQTMDGLNLLAETVLDEEVKSKSVPLPDNGTMGYRIIHIDCGRKYFKVTDLKKIIDYAYDCGYTHVELAFGNDGLRFLLNDMSVDNYTSDQVSKAIQAGNDAFDKAAGNSSLAAETEELTEDEMNELIEYAKDKGIGIIPMFDAPGHLYAVITAMQELGLTVKYSNPSNSGSSPNWAIDPTDTESINFVQALMQKYIDFFSGKCTMFNIAADECGFYIESYGSVKQKMSQAQYTAYAKLVNSLAARVQNANMTALVFNDGIYHKKCTLDTGISFDENIAVCYWTAGGNYATAATLAGQFKIINTNTGWYYVIGKEYTSDPNGTGSWTSYAYYQNWATTNMSKENSAFKVDGDTAGAVTPVGCMAAIWCDNPISSVIWENVSSYAAALAEAKGNSDYFKTPETPKEPVLTADKKTVEVNGTVTFTLENYTGDAEIDWNSSNPEVLELSAITRGNNTVEAIALAEGSATVTADVEDKTYSASVTVTAQQLEEREITVIAGSTKTDFIEGENYSTTNPPSTEDTTIATVESVEYGSKSTKSFTAASTVSTKNSYSIQNSTDKTQYLKADGTWGTIDEAAQWTPSSSSGGYYLQYGSNTYLRWNNGTWETTKSTSNCTRLYLNNGCLYATRTGKNNYTYSNPLGVPSTINNGTTAGTTVTFKGLIAGKTTYVTIGNVHYTIKVVEENLDGVKDFYIQLWTTNVTIEDENTTKTSATWHYAGSYTPQDIPAKYVTVNAKQAYGKAGIPLSELVTKEMVRYENGGTYYIAEQTGKSATTLVLLKGKALAKGSYQTVWADDRCNDETVGTTFQYVRYFNGHWAVSADGSENSWTNIDNCLQTEGYSSAFGTQVIAYYRIRTQIIDEVSTDLDEWATIPHTKQTNGFCLLDFRVKDDSGYVSPTSFPVTDKTMGFACGEGVRNSSADSDGVYYRMLNTINANAVDGYEIYMVTLTPTSDNKSEYVASTAAGATDYTYDGTEKVVWVDKEENLPDEYKNPDRQYTASPSGNATTYTVGGTPNLESVEIYYNQGLLVTYYVRQVGENLLTVHYRLDDGKEQDFHSYNISVAKNIFFNPNIALANPWKGDLANGTVTNTLKKDITVSADLTTMDQVPAEYRFANFTCTRIARLDETGNVIPDTDKTTKVKEVVLYYTVEYNVTLVVDFGLPVTITPEIVNSSLGNANIAKTEVVTLPKYATTKVVDVKNVVYKPDKTIDGKDNLSIKYTGTNLGTGLEGSVTYNVIIIPASNVYYEDSFVHFTPADGGRIVGWSIVNDDDKVLDTAPESNVSQVLETLNEKQNVYGYDTAYDNCTKFSMGTAMKTTVYGDKYALADFTFKGTGFDIISLTSNRSGTMIVTVTGADKTNADFKKNYMVDTYYGYDYVDDQWVVKENEPNTLYQIPVMKVTGLGYGTYKATVTVAYNEIFAHNGSESYDFYLDAVRVYEPLGPDGNDYYKKDGEGWPQYIEIRDQLIKNDTFNGSDGVVFIDGKEDAKIADYTSYGPNNEVYLLPNQSIAFKLSNVDSIAEVHIGAKAPMGNASLRVNDNAAKPIATATEMYYDITDAARAGNLVTITNVGADGTILSLTNVKVTFESDPGTTKVTLPMDASTAKAAVAMVRAMYTPAEPEVFTPERFEASWNRSSVKVGQKATLTVKTSTDVDTITVDGVTVTNYRTRTQRTGWGWNAKKVTYREFTYTITAAEAGTLNVSVAAVNAESVSSEPITAALTVQAVQRPQRPSWLDKIFSRWF